jgi:hypothetical protein
MFGWPSKTIIGVALFLFVLWSMRAFEQANAGVYLGLGHTVANSSLTSPEVGYQRGKYRFALEATGEGDTDKGAQDVTPLFSVYRVIDPNWCWASACFKSGIGLAYTPKQILVGTINYRLELILSLPADVEFYAKHYSSAGTFENNTGLDVIGVRFLF